MREAPVPFAAAVKPNVVGPVPLVPVGVSHPPVLAADAVQPHPALVTISTLPPPPPAGCTGLFALKLNEHGNPAWLTE